ncbi:MAG: response regulator [Algisphaera sp.]
MANSQNETGASNTPKTKKTARKAPDAALFAKQVFTTGEAADICKVSQQTIIRCFDAGRLNGFRVPGSRFRRIPREELIRFMRNNDIPSDGFDTGKRRVLVVDDDPAIIELYHDVLGRDPKIEIRSAATGYDAGLVSSGFKPEIMVLDYMLPDINGNIVCQTIRNNPHLKDMKILLVSGVVNQTEIDNLLESGADAFLKKPFDIDTLRERIHALLTA